MASTKRYPSCGAVGNSGYGSVYKVFALGIWIMTSPPLGDLVGDSRFSFKSSKCQKIAVSRSGKMMRSSRVTGNGLSAALERAGHFSTWITLAPGWFIFPGQPHDSRRAWRRLMRPQVPQMVPDGARYSRYWSVRLPPPHGSQPASRSLIYAAVISRLQQPCGEPGKKSSVRLSAPHFTENQSQISHLSQINDAGLFYQLAD